MTIGERIRIVRKAVKMTQTAFGERVGVSPSTISLLEKDETVSERTIRDICKTYGISRQWLEDGSGEMYEQAESIDDLTLSFTELLSEYPGILAMAKLASKHMTVDDWKRLNELLERTVQG